jgi:septal ring factor EnvC (AmiA/AmiB activator)
VLRDRRREDLSERDSRLSELREAELALTGITGELAELERDVQQARDRRDALEVQLEERRAALSAEREALAAQLVAIYKAGPSPPLRLLLMQENPAEMTRLLTWQSYLSRYRAAEVERLGEAVSSLTALREARDAETARVEALADQRRRRVTALEQVRQERADLVAALDADIRVISLEIDQIEARERELVRLLEDLAELFSDVPAAELAEPFGKRRGKLPWPLEGELLADYGADRVGKALRWKGLLIGSERGAPVQAVAHGRVAYADWLPGLGLLMILEHGDGYLSLYGHNDALLREVGDWVAPGESIATVGDSGGQPRPALYFEIRSGRQQLNPQLWFARRIRR